MSTWDSFPISSERENTPLNTTVDTNVYTRGPFYAYTATWVPVNAYTHTWVPLVYILIILEFRRGEARTDK